MARTPRLSPRFLERRTALGIVSRSPESRAIAATIVSLCNAAIAPGPSDAFTLLESNDGRGVATLVHVRRVGGFNLWIWYRDLGDVVELATLTDRAPGHKQIAGEETAGRTPNASRRIGDALRSIRKLRWGRSRACSLDSDAHGRLIPRGATWMAVRGDQPLAIKRVLGHRTFATTEIYIREADAIREGFGEVFPALPAAVVDPFGTFARIMPVAKLPSPIRLKKRGFQRGGRDSLSSCTKSAEPDERSESEARADAVSGLASSRT